MTGDNYFLIKVKRLALGAVKKKKRPWKHTVFITNNRNRVNPGY